MMRPLEKTVLKPSVSTLVEFFRREVPCLPETYHWRIPEIEGFIRSGEFGYSANRDLKTFLHERWLVAVGQEKVRLAHVIISDWGGVRSNRAGTLQSYVDALSTRNPPMPLKGVASYSKLYSIAYPETYAIYDARVAACLNAVQINGGLGRGIAFNYVPGRNNVVGNVETKQGFTQMARFKIRSLVKRGWVRIKRDETYSQYLDLLERCREQTPGYDLPQLEMALFANARAECLRAMGRAH